MKTCVYSKAKLNINNIWKGKDINEVSDFLNVFIIKVICVFTYFIHRQRIDKEIVIGHSVINDLLLNIIPD